MTEKTCQKTTANEAVPRDSAPALEKKRRIIRRPTPEVLADVAMIDASTCAAAACVSLTYFLDEVRAGRGPTPLRFGLRCTRFRTSEVRAWLIARVEKAVADTQAAAQLTSRATSRAKKASAAARAKRAAAASGQ